MARSCGIRLGPRRFELVVLDGSPKKHRITAFKVAEFPQDAEDPVAAAVATLKETAKSHSVPSENVAIAVDTGLGAFRTLKLPFSDREKINEVIKFELESELPQWNIDDVVVDFLPMEKTEHETTLLVTAVPKWQLERAIDLATRAGLEPLECELEATAMVNAALSADICHADDAQILVHVGELSTSVVVVDAGHVRSVRAIHIGALSHEPAQGEEEGAEQGAEAPVVAPAESEEERARRLEHAVSRIRRELGRTISGGRTVNTIDSIFVCGMELPGLIGSSILDVPVYELDVFEEQSGQPAEGTAPLVVAYGVALRQLGGGLIPASLRREELRYTGAFEKIELPLAVAALLMVTWLSVFCIFELNQVQLREQDVDLWRKSSNNYMLGMPAEGIPGKLEVPPDSITNYIEGIRKRSLKPGMTARDNPEIDPERTRLEQMENTKRLLQIEVANLSKALGHTGEVTAPQSALEALTRSIKVLDDLGERVGRHSIRSVRSAFQPGNVSKPDSVRVTLDMTFFADSGTRATKNLEEFTQTLEAQPWVTSVSSRGSKALEEGSLEEGETGIFVDGLEILCDLSKVERNKPLATKEAGE
jgi:Tfp pilus assembly PilM family ATPase